MITVCRLHLGHGSLSCIAIPRQLPNRHDDVYLPYKNLLWLVSTSGNPSFLGFPKEIHPSTRLCTELLCAMFAVIDWPILRVMTTIFGMHEETRHKQSGKFTFLLFSRWHFQDTLTHAVSLKYLTAQHVFWHSIYNSGLPNTIYGILNKIFYTLTQFHLCYILTETMHQVLVCIEKQL